MNGSGSGIPLVTTNSAYRREAYQWGELLWGASAENRNSNELTVGWCLISPGEANGLHYHPNCEEVLVVVEGRIRHSWDGQLVDMGPGDAIILPAGVVHNAENLGRTPARLLICFSTADRQTVSVGD